MTELTSSWKRTRSPMTMASSFVPSLNAAHDVRPIKGGRTEPSTTIFTSLRGAVTLNTPSSLFKVPLRRVISSMRAVFSFWSSGRAEAPAKRVRRTNLAFKILFFMRHILLWSDTGSSRKSNSLASRPGAQTRRREGKLYAPFSERHLLLSLPIRRKRQSYPEPCYPAINKYNIYYDDAEDW